MHDSRCESGEAFRQISRSWHLTQIDPFKLRRHIVRWLRQKYCPQFSAQCSTSAASFSLTQFQMQIVQSTARAHLLQPDALQCKLVDADLTFRAHALQQFAGGRSYRAPSEQGREQTL